MNESPNIHDGIMSNVSYRRSYNGKHTDADYPTSSCENSALLIVEISQKSKSPASSVQLQRIFKLQDCLTSESSLPQIDHAAEVQT